MWAGVVCALHCTVATWLEVSGAKQLQRNSLGRGKEHMCCAKPSLNGACTREQLSIHVKTNITVEMHVSSET